MTSAVGVIQQANVPAAAFLQKSKDSLIGKPLLVFVADVDKRVYLDRLAYLTTPGGSLARNWMLMFLSASGASLSANVNVTTQRDSREQAVTLRWSIRETSIPS